MNDNTELSGALSSLNIGGDDELNDNDMSTVAILCANCGTEESGDINLKSWVACKMVKYCNRDCQVAHRPQHKKSCKKRAAELYDEKLFIEPPPHEDCPICMLPLPLAADQILFEACCGKDICNGCVYAMVESKGAKLCAFCRTPYAKSDEEEVERLKKLTEKGNADAYYVLGGCYALGNGLPQNRAKANELYLKAGELGCAAAYFNLGNAYDNGRGVEIDKQKAKYFYELAAMNGSVKARHNLGCIEEQAGNFLRAYKHLILAARAGFKQSLDAVKEGYKDGIVTKDEYANTLRAYQKSHDETKSEARDKDEAYRNL